MHALPPQQQHPLFNLQHDADPAADSCGGQVLLELGADGADVAVGAGHLPHSGGVPGVGGVMEWIRCHGGVGGRHAGVQVLGQGRAEADGARLCYATTAGYMLCQMQPLLAADGLAWHGMA